MKIEALVIHCSDSDFGDIDDIRKWHVDERGWRDVGYHAVITNGKPDSSFEYFPKKDGLLQSGRALNLDDEIYGDEVAAHALGYNNKSVGVCLIGKDKFTVDQMRTLYYFVNMYKRISPNLKILGHCETERSGGKTCPNIDMDKLRVFLDSYKITRSNVLECLDKYIQEFK